MLKITQILAEPERPTIKLEGKLLAPWIENVADACDPAKACRPIRLDLSSLTYADAEGTQLLRRLLSRGAELGPCSGFLAELLHVEQRP